MHRVTHLIVLALFTLSAMAPPVPAEARRARTLHKAVKKKYAKAFEKRPQHARRLHGHSKKKSHPNRFGDKGDYFAQSRKRALAETTSARRLPTRAAIRRAGAKVNVYKGKGYRTAMKKRVNVNSLSNKRLKKMTHMDSLRGCKKNGVVGPKLGKKLGAWANKEKRVLRYQPRAKLPGEKSTRGRWGNIYVPHSLKRPNTVKPGDAVSKLSRTRK